MATSRVHIRLLAGAALLAGWSSAPTPAAADEPQANDPLKTPAHAGAEADVPTLNLLDAMRDGSVAVKAEGMEDGRMTVSVTNKTQRRINVVLPPGLIASGASGQMGGMGGMGMGGMGGMGGGMGGMGMGGMGGGMGGMGMGGMGGGMGGMGMGGMGGGMMGGGTMPPTMGMMLLSRLIMQLCGDYDSWDQRAMASGMGGMGGMGMGGMGGMGGGMGGMGGMGGGMRSVPPTGLPFASLKPGQTRNLPTRLVSLNQPDAQTGRRVLAAKGEKLTLGDIGQISDDPMVQQALKRLAAEKAPDSISQMVMWRVASGMEWSEIAQLAEKWGNPYELTLAQDFVDRLGGRTNGETGELLFQVDAADAGAEATAAELTRALKDKPVLGLWAREGVPAEPTGPAVSCRVRLGEKEATVVVNSSNSAAQAWVPFGKFTLPIEEKDGKFDVETFADGLAEGVLNRLVRAQLSNGPRVQGKLTYKIRIDNASPLILNGLAILGVDKQGEEPNELSGVSIGPRRSMTFPATGEVVRDLGLKKGVRVFAADLSGL